MYFWSLNKGLKAALLVSMAGLKIKVLESFLESSERLTDVFLCVDNDEAGKAFVKDVQAKINAKALFPPTCKDWNEYLQIKKAMGQFY